MKPKGLAVDKDSPDFKKILEYSADDNLLASIEEQGKRKFFTYLKNKLTPIQEEKLQQQDKSEHKCNQFETATLLTTTKTTTGNEDAKDVSQKNMPTVQLPSTNLNNIESNSSQANANNNIQSLGKWNTSPEHLKQVTNNIEKHQQSQQQTQKDNQQPATKSVQSTSKHHLPPLTRKTILGPVPQARSSFSHHLVPKDLQSNINYKAIYQPTSNTLNPMSSYISSNGQEWIVTKQRIQRPKDHNILTLDPITVNNNYHYAQSAHPITDADIRKQEFIERKIAQEQYRQQLEQQIMQQKPVRSIKPRTTLKFDGEAEFKTETRQNYKPFRFVTNLNDFDKKGNTNDKSSRKQSIEKEHHNIQSSNQHQMNGEQQQQVHYNKSNRPQSSLTSCGKFKEHLQNQPDPSVSQRRHLNQIEHHSHKHHQTQHHYNKNHDIEPQQYEYEKEQQFNEELVDENNNLIDQHNHSQYQNMQQQNEPMCCDHCRHHYFNGINVPIGPATNQNQIELNPLVGARALSNKHLNRMNDLNQPIRKNLKARDQSLQRHSQQSLQQQQTNLVRSKSTHFQPIDKEQQRDATIPRMIIPGKQKPHKNMSHLKFEGPNCFVTTHNLMYRDHSMQNLSNYPLDENSRQLNRGVFAEQMMENSNGKKSITGNIRGRSNKYRDLFASSEDIFGNQNYPNNQLNNKLSVKHKSAINLPQATNDEYYLDDDPQLEDNYDYDGNEYDNYGNDYQNQQDYQNNYYQNEQQATPEREQLENEVQYEEDNDSQLINEAYTSKQSAPQKKLIFIPKNQPPPNNLLNTNNFERRKDLSTTNSAYGSQLMCPALDLTTDSKYQYKYTIGGHKYFVKKSSIG